MHREGNELVNDNGDPVMLSSTGRATVTKALATLKVILPLSRALEEEVLRFADLGDLDPHLAAQLKSKECNAGKLALAANQIRDNCTPRELDWQPIGVPRLRAEPEPA